MSNRMIEIGTHSEFSDENQIVSIITEGEQRSNHADDMHKENNSPKMIRKRRQCSNCRSYNHIKNSKKCPYYVEQIRKYNKAGSSSPASTKTKSDTIFEGRKSTKPIPTSKSSIHRETNLRDSVTRSKDLKHKNPFTATPTSNNRSLRKTTVRDSTNKTSSVHKLAVAAVAKEIKSKNQYVDDYSVSFSPGSLGMKLEPIVRSASGEKGCKIVGFVDVSETNKSQARLSGKIHIGDAVVFIDGVAVLSKRYADIFTMLRKPFDGDRRVITFRCVRDSPSKYKNIRLVTNSESSNYDTVYDKTKVTKKNSNNYTKEHAEDSQYLPSEKQDPHSEGTPITSHNDEQSEIEPASTYEKNVSETVGQNKSKTADKKCSKCGSYSHIKSSENCPFHNGYKAKASLTRSETCNNTEQKNEEIDLFEICTLSFPHLIFFVAFIYAKLSMPRVLRFIVTKTKVMNAIMLWIPLYQTICFLSMNEGSTNEQEQGTEKKEKKSVVNQRQVADKTTQQIRETAISLLQFWVVHSIYNCIYQLWDILPFIQSSFSPIISRISIDFFNEIFFFLWVWLRYLPLPTNTTDNNTNETVTSPTVIIFSILSPILLDFGNNAVSVSSSPTLSSARLTSLCSTLLKKMDSFFDIAILLKFISPNTKSIIYQMVSDGRMLFPGFLTLFLPSMLTQYGCIYINSIIPSINSVQCCEQAHTTTRNINRWLKYWVTQALFQYILSIACWVPFKIHFSLLAWLYLNLPFERYVGACFVYELLEYELIGFGLLPSSSSQRDNADVEMHDTLTVKMFAKLIRMLPSSVIDENHNKTSPSPSILDSETNTKDNKTSIEALVNISSSNNKYAFSQSDDILSSHVITQEDREQERLSNE